MRVLAAFLLLAFLFLVACSGPEDYYRQIVDAAGKKNFALADTLLHSLPNIDWKNKEGETLLLSAAIINSPELARMALAHGASIGFSTKYWPPLFYAVLPPWGRQLLEVLLSNGADPNAQATDGKTAMHLAANFGNVAAMRRLLAYGADPLRRSKNGWTLLHYIADGARRTRMTANIKATLALAESWGVSRSTRNAKGQTAAEMAYEKGVTAKSKGGALVARRLFEAAGLLKEKAP